MNTQLKVFMKFIERLTKLERQIKLIEGKPSQVVINKIFNTLDKAEVINGELTLTMLDGKSFNLGAIKGKDGESIKGDPGHNGESIKGDPGADGRTVELVRAGEVIAWKYQDSDTAYPLIAVEELRGPAGRAGKNGKDGLDGPHGRGIVSIDVQRNGDILVEYSDGEIRNAGRVHIIMGGGGLQYGSFSATTPINYNAGTGNFSLNPLTVADFASPDVSQWTNDAGYITGADIPDHNDLNGLQGGTTDEYYHLSSIKYTFLNDINTTVSQWANDAGYLTEVPWGTITGLLSNQVDLKSALNAKQSTTLTNSHILVGNGSNVAVDVAMSGDATIANTGALTLATVNANVGSFGSNTESAIVVVDAKGRVTAATQITITPDASSVTGGAALTRTNDTNVTLTLGGSATNALLKATSITVGWSGQLSLARGGTNANLTASNGGIFYSTASAGAILSGTATARQMLQSGSSAAPAWSTSTWPATTTVNRILYSSGTNTVSEITTGNNGVLITSSGGVPSISSTLPNAVQDNITRLGTIASGAVPASLVTSGAALTKVDDTNITLTLGGSPTDALLKAASITAGWTGTLAQSRGGTGVNSWQPWYDLRQASSNLILWLEASDPSNDGTEVAGTYQTWVNKTGSTLDPTQGTAANRPALVLAAQNDLPCMRFDGTNDTYRISDNSAFDCTNGFICIIACKPRSGGAGNYVLMNKRDVSANLGWQISAVAGAGAGTGLQFCNSTTCYYTTAGVTPGSAQIYTWQMTSTVGQMWIDGVLLYSASGNYAPTDIASSNIEIGSDRGASNFFDGDMYAVALFNANTPLQTIRYVEAMFKQKYGTV